MSQPGAAGLLVFLRLVDGIFLGGHTAANPLAMEYASRHPRGLYGSPLNIGHPAALGFMTLLTMPILEVMPSGDADAAYSVWGWRIPFVDGFVLSFAVFWHYLRSVPESELWAKTSNVGNPLKALLSGQEPAPLRRRVCALDRRVAHPRCRRCVPPDRVLHLEGPEACPPPAGPLTGAVRPFGERRRT